MDLSICKSSISWEIRDEGGVQRGVEDILVALRTCGIDVPGATHERITDRDGPDRLRLWLPRAATATSAEELFDGS
ncbi:hypothetical protein ACFXDH_10255 [Streptomyces sp. NPDC059467]|uniref:hypothetical protein n=1 Tax=Streptomyces sp. NPDC059467 TaxID=3346844 RepID=UPI003677E658